MAAPRLALLAGLLVTAGCLGAEAPGATDAGTAAPPAAGAPPAAAAPAPLRASDHPPVHEVLWVNGTFEASQHGSPTGMVARMAGLDWPNRVRTDVTEHVPADLPVRIVVEVQAATTDGDVDIWLDVGDNTWWTGDWDTPRGGYSHVEAVIVRDGGDPVVVVLQYDELDRSASFDYALRIEVQAEPALFPVAVPYALTLEPGARLGFVYHPRAVPGLERAASAAVVWDPRDALLARVPFVEDRATLALPADAPAGEYVVAFAQGSGAVEVSVLASGAPVQVRRLAAEFTVGEPREVPRGEESVTWTFEAPRAPWLVGLFSLQGPVVGTSARGAMQSPAGALFDFAAEGPFLLPGTGGDSGYGAENLVPGTYTATAGFGREAGPDAGAFAEFLLHYRR